MVHHIVYCIIWGGSLGILLYRVVRHGVVYDAVYCFEIL